MINNLTIGAGVLAGAFVASLVGALCQDPSQQAQSEVRKNDQEAESGTPQYIAQERVGVHEDAPFGVRGGSALTLSDSARAKSHRSGDHTPLPLDVESSTDLRAPKNH